MMEHLEMLRYLQQTFPTESAMTIVEQVREGRDFPTQAIIIMSRDVQFHGKLVKKGVVDAVLDHLKHPNRTFEEELAPSGDLAFPTVWINVLLNLSCPPNLPQEMVQAVQMKVAGNIGPLNCVMVDCNQREFFCSKEDWLSGTFFFVALIANLVLSPPAKNIVEQHKGLRQFLVRMLYLDLYGGNRKDEMIEAEAKKRCLPGCIGKMQNSAACALQEFADVSRDINGLTLEGITELKVLSNIPVAPDVDVTFATGLLDLIELINLCNSKVFVRYPDRIPDILNAVFASIIRTESYGAHVVDDQAVASAISNGLVKVCIEFLLRSKGDRSVTYSIDRIIQSVGDVALEGKTNTVLNEKAPSIRMEMDKVRCQMRGCF